MSDEVVKSEPEPEPEPEGIIEVELGGQKVKVAPVGVISAERKRARESTEQKIRAEYEPVKAKAQQADQLASDLAALQPHIDYLNKHPELMKAPPTDDVPDVSDADAERYARQYELYTPTGLDTPRAKRIIADNRSEMKRVAKEAAAEAVQPYAQTTATQAARQNYVWAASQQDAEGRPLVDAQELAQLWATFPPELAANPDVARVILDAAIGQATRSGKRGHGAPQEPVFTEAPGGGRDSAYRMSEPERKLAKNVGLSEKQWADSAKQYRPDAINILGD